MTHETVKRLFDDIVKYNSNSSIGEKKQHCNKKQKWITLPPKGNKAVSPYKERITAYVDGSFLDLWKENILVLPDLLPVLLKRCQRIRKRKMIFSIFLRLLLVKHVISVKPKSLTSAVSAESKRKIYAILKCNSCSTVWNRDVMVAKNMHYIFTYISQHNNKRHPRIHGFCFFWESYENFITSSHPLPNRWVVYDAFYDRLFLTFILCMYIF